MGGSIQTEKSAESVKPLAPSNLQKQGRKKKDDSGKEERLPGA